MSYAGFMWECACGQLEHGEDSPEECMKCGKINSFVKLPEELIEEREREFTEEELELDSVREVKKQMQKRKAMKKAKMQKTQLNNNKKKGRKR
ncbi:hypothetical protein HYV50_06030 [Candidatus Pacearchaeota archaeon]|nr:hypothetical protein [Candidatus Pacearchaeota archaeon]